MMGFEHGGKLGCVNGRMRGCWLAGMRVSPDGAMHGYWARGCQDAGIHDNVLRGLQDAWMDDAGIADRRIHELQDRGMRVAPDACMADTGMPDCRMPGFPASSILGRLIHGSWIPEAWKRGRRIRGFRIPDSVSSLRPAGPRL